MQNFDDMKLAVEALSGGKNTVLFDDVGMPGIYVPMAKSTSADVMTGGAATTHPAFIVGGVEKNLIYISKYLNIVMNNRAYSLPFKDPGNGMNFDSARTFCQNKGNGFHLMTNAEWAYVAHWTKKNGTMPRGNNNLGKDASAAHEKGVGTSFSGSTVYRTATGSGPASWAHDNTNDGIFDLNGNVNEWCGGLRLNGGEIQIIPNNDAAQAVDQGASSTLWKAIMPDGSIVDPGTAGTLKWDYSTAAPTGGASTPNIHLIAEALANQQVDEAAGFGLKTFETVTAKAGVTVPEIMKSLALFPVDGAHGADNFYFRNVGERMCCRGGAYNDGSGAGVFLLNLGTGRTSTTTTLGFRSAFVNL